MANGGHSVDRIRTRETTPTQNEDKQYISVWFQPRDKSDMGRENDEETRLNLQEDSSEDVKGEVQSRQWLKIKLHTIKPT